MKYFDKHWSQDSRSRTAPSAPNEFLQGSGSGGGVSACASSACTSFAGGSLSGSSSSSSSSSSTSAGSACSPSSTGSVGSTPSASPSGFSRVPLAKADSCSKACLQYASSTSAWSTNSVVLLPGPTTSAQPPNGSEKTRAKRSASAKSQALSTGFEILYSSWPYPAQNIAATSPPSPSVAPGGSKTSQAASLAASATTASQNAARSECCNRNWRTKGPAAKRANAGAE
mmetsp:Transcript_55732/g.155330  ORF Transcript_55732/g.155330 Transcript_55732/m.155330 type:complete len:228 (+) Transcript_55732:2371-3054(+)